MSAFNQYAALTPNYGIAPEKALAMQNPEGTPQYQFFQKNLADQQGKYAIQGQKIGAEAQKYGANQAAEANRYGSNLQLQGLQAQLGQQQKRFDQLFPYFQGLAGQAGLGGGGGGSYGGPFGASTALAQAGNQSAPTQPGAVGNYGYGSAPPPQVAPGPSPGGLPPAISQGQTQANINLNNAQNWSQAGGETRRQTQQMAGGGLGANSPLARALKAQVFGGALAANTAGATNAQMQAAQLNANQALGAYQSQNAANASMYGSRVGAQAGMYGAQQAAEASRYGSGLDYQAALAQVQAQRQNAILAALGNFVS